MPQDHPAVRVCLDGAVRSSRGGKPRTGESPARWPAAAGPSRLDIRASAKSADFRARQTGETTMHLRRMMASVAFAAGLAALPLTTANAQYYRASVLAVSAALAVLCGGCCHRRRRDDCDGAIPGLRRTAATLWLLRVARLSATAQLPATRILLSAGKLPPALRPALSDRRLLRPASPIVAALTPGRSRRFRASLRLHPLVRVRYRCLTASGEA